MLRTTCWWRQLSHSEVGPGRAAGGFGVTVSRSTEALEDEHQGLVRPTDELAQREQMVEVAEDGGGRHRYSAHMPEATGTCTNVGRSWTAIASRSASVSSSRPATSLADMP